MDTKTTPPVTATVQLSVALPSRGRRFTQIQALPIAAATLLLFVVGAVLVPASLSRPSLLAMIIPAAVMAVAAAGQTLVIQQKGIDLSVGPNITLGAILLGFTSGAGVPVWLSVVITLASGVLVGLVNALLVTRLSITPIIATLAMGALVTGVVWTVSRGNYSAPPPSVRDFGSAQIWGLPAIVWMALALVVLIGVFMWKSSFGRRFVAVGAAPEAARAAGTPTFPYLAAGYIGSSLFACLAGILLSGYVGTASFNIGDAYLLPVIAAVFVGGAALSGGKGSVVASAVGALFLSYLVQLVLTLGAPGSLQLLIQAIALAAAATIRSVPWRKLFSRKNAE